MEKVTVTSVQEVNPELFEIKLRHVVVGRNPAFTLPPGLYTRQEAMKALMSLGVSGPDLNTILAGCVRNGLLQVGGEPSRFRLMVRLAAQGNA